MNGTSKHANDACLLFDDEPVESKRGVVRRMMTPTRCEEPVLVPERSWEIDAWCGDPGASVLQDIDGTCHLWYMLKYADGDAEPTAPLSLVAELDEKTRADFASMKRYILCYARSQDGIHWEKPDCGIFEYGGSLRNNIVMSARLGGTVILDPNAPPEERMKMLLGGGPRIPYIGKGQSKPSKNVYHAIYGASSPDGVHWRMTEEPVLPWYTDTTNVVYWDDQRDKYVAFVRWNHGMSYEEGSTVVRDTCFYRAIGRAESADFHRFPSPERILAPSEQLWSPPAEGTDYYNTAAMKYPFAPDSYFLFISMFSLLLFWRIRVRTEISKRKEGIS
ncbi:MAG: hypothetical protein KAI66_09910, partial [Lentisphaeria bacterium]|nr:hypothetical protein [Lentisphaeria bacterium]